MQRRDRDERISTSAGTGRPISARAASKDLPESPTMIPDRQQADGASGEGRHPHEFVMLGADESEYRPRRARSCR